MWNLDALNGDVYQAIRPNSTVELMVDAVGGGGIQGVGYFTHSFITFDVIPAPPCEPPRPWDLDGSGTVDVTDSLALLAQWGPCA